jgi:hypothetical protein
MIVIITSAEFDKPDKPERYHIFWMGLRLWPGSAINVLNPLPAYCARDTDKFLNYNLYGMQPVVSWYLKRGRLHSNVIYECKQRYVTIRLLYKRVSLYVIIRRTCKSSVLVLEM